MLFLIALIVLLMADKLRDGDHITGFLVCALIEVIFELIIVASRYADGTR